LVPRAFGVCPGEQPVYDVLRLAIGSTVSKAGIPAPAIQGEEWFLYSVNTIGNSSGSPVLRASDGLVLGIHAGDHTAVPNAVRANAGFRSPWLLAAISDYDTRVAQLARVIPN
jgi:hypothetical protein